MTLYVVDASVAAKWFVAEEQSEHAQRLLLLGGGPTLIAPDILPAELVSVFCKKVSRGHLSIPLAREAAAGLAQMRVHLLPTIPLAGAALSVALRYSRSSYDSLYLALAMREQCPLVTADRRLFNGLAGEFPGQLVWVGDL